MNRFALLFPLVLLASCAAITTSSGGRVGTNGWMEKRNKTDEYIEVERPGGQVEIGDYDRGRYFVRVHRPEGDVEVPLFPGSELDDTQERAIWVNRIYRMPEGKTFRDVYAWYMDYFDFQDVK